MDKTQELTPKQEITIVDINENFSMFNNALVVNGIIAESVEVTGVGTLTAHANPKAEDVHGTDNLAVVFDLDTGYKESAAASGTQIALGPDYVLYAGLADGTTHASLGKKSFLGGEDKFAPKVETYSFDSWLETDPASESVGAFKSRARKSQRVSQPLTVKGDPKAARFKITK
jgi:hypothetical protein